MFQAFRSMSCADVSGTTEARVAATGRGPSVIRPTAQRVKPYHIPHLLAVEHTLPQAPLQIPHMLQAPACLSGHSIDLARAPPGGQQMMSLPEILPDAWACVPPLLTASPADPRSRTPSGDSRQQLPQHVPLTPPHGATSSDSSHRSVAGVSTSNPSCSQHYSGRRLHLQPPPARSHMLSQYSLVR